MAKKKSREPVELVTFEQPAHVFTAMIAKAASEVPGGEANAVMELVERRSFAKYKADVEAGTHEQDLKRAAMLEKLYPKAKALHDEKKRRNDGIAKGRRSPHYDRAVKVAEKNTQLNSPGAFKAELKKRAFVLPATVRRERRRKRTHWTR